MLKELLKNPTALIYAIAVHAVLIAILVVSIQWNAKPAPLTGTDKIVQATVIDEAALQAEKQRKLDDAAAKRQAAEEQLRQAELEQRRADEALRRKQQEADRQRQAKLKADQEAKERQRSADQKRQLALATQRLAVAAQLKAEKAKRKAEAARKADEAQFQRENEEFLQQQLAQEEANRQARAAAAQRQKQLASLRDQYEVAIAQKVERNWIRPVFSAQPGSCRVRVKQIPGGDVVNVDASACGGDPSYRQSVEAAVFRAAPLPQPPDPAVFDRDIIFTFKPNQ